MRKVLLVIVLSVTSTCWAGVTYTAVTRTILGARNHVGDMRVQAWVEGKQARMEFVESEMPQLESGTYLVTSDGGDTTFLVDPRSRTYERWDVDSIVQNMADMMRSMRGQMNVRFEVPKVEKLLDEPGPEIDGLPTRHYRYRTSYLAYLGLDEAETISTVTEEEIWTTTAIKEPGVLALLNKRTSSGDEELDRIIKAEMDKVPGFPLKHITSTRTETRNETTESRTEMDIVEVKNVPVPASMFAIPKGYTELDPNDSDMTNAIKKLEQQKNRQSQ